MRNFVPSMFPVPKSHVVRQGTNEVMFSAFAVFLPHVGETPWIEYSRVLINASIHMGAPSWNSRNECTISKCEILENGSRRGN